MIGMFIIFLGLILAILFAAHFVTYKALLIIFAITDPHAISWIRVGFGFLWLSFVAASVIAFRYNNFFSRLFYKIAVGWLGFLLYLFFASCIFAIVYAVAQSIAPGVSLILFGKILVCLAMLTSLYGLYNAHTIVITPVAVHLENLPTAWKGRKAVLISDMHLGQVHGAEFAERVVNMVNAEHPDIIFNTGDLYDGVKVDPVSIVEPLKNLKAPLGTFYVTGNHEEFGDNAPFLNAVRNTGITVLNNQNIQVDGVQIVGVDYKDTNKKTDFESVIKNIQINRNQPSILLKHVPMNLEVARDAGISLQLSGHTHKAQVFPFSLITRGVFKGFDYGLKALNSLQVLVTSGVGTWGPPYRVGTKSEIVVITFE